MKETQAKKMSTQTMVLAALLTALVIVLQFAGSSIRFGMFSISLVLIPIVIGAATCGAGIGAWLGLVFGVVVLASGDAAPFMALSVPGTIITVLAKGMACGFVAGLAYKAVYSLATKSQKLSPHTKRFVSVLAAAIVCPVVNTGVFLIGCLLFFFEIFPKDAGAGEIIKHMIFVLVGGNFLFELGTNIILNPVIVRLLDFKNKKM